MANPPLLQPPIDKESGRFVIAWSSWFSRLVEAATGATDRVTFPSGATITSGAYNPEGAETAIGGSMFLRTDTYRMYVKQSASGNTGWSLK